MTCTLDSSPDTSYFRAMSALQVQGAQIAHHHVYSLHLRMQHGNQSVHRVADQPIREGSRENRHCKILFG